MNYKLPTTIVADVILLTSFDTIFTDISTVTLRAFHGNYPRFHTLIMQRRVLNAYDTEPVPCRTNCLKITVTQIAHPFDHTHHFSSQLSC